MLAKPICKLPNEIKCISYTGLGSRKTKFENYSYIIFISPSFIDRNFVGHHVIHLVDYGNK
jgi:hypothetical protein